MDTATGHAGHVFPAIFAVVAACLLAGPPPAAADDVRIIPVVSDGRGNAARVEIESVEGRKIATPVVEVRDERFLQLLENPADNGATIALPVPRLMRLVERARKAIRDMKRPDPAPPAGAAAAEANATPAAEPPKAAAATATPAARPGDAGPEILPPEPLLNTATR